MAEATLQSLITAARRRVWRGEFGAAARWASWGTIPVTLLAVAVHLALRPIGIGFVAAALLLLWAALFARAGLRRPTDAACALWVDRHAGGASAYSTLLEMRASASTAQTPAFAWLERWASAKVPESLRLLEERRDPLRLARPLLAVIVCVAFATIVLTLPGLAPSALPAPSTSRNVAEPATPETSPSVAGQLVGDLASALHAAESRRSSGGRPLGSSPAKGPGGTEKTTELEMAPMGTVAGSERGATGSSAAGNAAAAASAAGATGSNAGAGRRAGESADDRADAGSSRAARGTMPLQTRESTARLSPSLQADMNEPATFDEDSRVAQAASARGNRAPPAAPPPATHETAHLNATQSAYVQAWMKAIGPRH